MSLGALFQCEHWRESSEVFFFAGVAGGQVISMDRIEVTVITSQSPLAARVRGLKVGQDFILPNGSAGRILAVE